MVVAIKRRYLRYFRQESSRSKSDGNMVRELDGAESIAPGFRTQFRITTKLGYGPQQSWVVVAASLMLIQVISSEQWILAITHKMPPKGHR